MGLPWLNHRSCLSRTANRSLRLLDQRHRGCSTAFCIGGATIRRRWPSCASLLQTRLAKTNQALTAAFASCDDTSRSKRWRSTTRAATGSKAGRRHGPPNAGVTISLRRRAEVLAPQRCAQCGRKPLEDHVKLVVDYKVPLSWGGDNEPENLQPLCEECYAGKRDYFRSFEAYAEQIRAAIGYDEPQKRIGELLKAFDGTWVRSDLLGIVASAKNFQEDWQRRMRDLRFLGWDYQHEKRYGEGSRVWTYYRLTKSAPWPENISQAIRAEETRRKALKKRLSTSPD